MVDELFGCELWIGGVADQVDGILVIADVPELCDRLEVLDGGGVGVYDMGLTPSQARIRNSSISGWMTVSVV